MAKYTITIRTLLENDFDFGLQNYPIFDAQYRSVLNEKILNHYFESEIGFETAELFKFYLNNKMNEIMPKYNVLYNIQKELLQNIINNVNLTETNEHKDTTEHNDTETENGTTNTSSNSNSTSDGKDLYQDTPQGQISFTDLENQSYATNYTLTHGQANDTSSTNGTSTSTLNKNGTTNNFGDYFKKITGSNGNKYSYEILADVIEAYKDLDLLIIAELSDLFMGIL